MCKKLKGCGRKIDKCMQYHIYHLNMAFKDHIQTVACCCGHSIYSMTIVINTGYGIFELISGKRILNNK